MKTIILVVRFLEHLHRMPERNVVESLKMTNNWGEVGGGEDD